MRGELIPVPVPGADALMATQFDGREWAALKPMCETLGISFPAQLRKLQGRSWAVVAQRAMTAADGKTYQTTVVDSETIPLWLATIDENRVADDAKPRLIAYQREARDALHAYFNHRIAAPAPAMNQLDVLRAALASTRSRLRTARPPRLRQLAQRNEARLDGIEAPTRLVLGSGVCPPRRHRRHITSCDEPARASGCGDREKWRHHPRTCPTPTLRPSEPTADVGVGGRH